MSMARSYYNLPKTFSVTEYASLDEYLLDLLLTNRKIGYKENKSRNTIPCIWLV